jgi:hypothetical protein
MVTNAHISKRSSKYLTISDCDSIFAAHPRRRKAFQLINIKHWWPEMRQGMGDHAVCCNRDGRDLRAPLGDADEPTEAFQIVIFNITGPYFNPRRSESTIVPADSRARLQPKQI